MLVGILVLFGWTAGVETLKRLAPGLVAMNPATAVLFVFAGAALWLKHSRGDGLNANAAEARLAQILAGLVILGAALKFAEMWFGWSSGIDQWLFAQKLAGAFDTQPNRMAPNTALGFLLIGLALATLSVTTRRGLRPAEVLASLAFVIALLAPVGLIYRVPQFAGWAHYIPMALPTAATFMLLSVGVFMARPDAGMMAVVGSATAAGMMVRRLYPAMMLALLVMGWLRLEGERRNFYGMELGVALYTIANIVVLGLLVWRSANALHRAAVQQRAGDERMRLSEERTQAIIETASDAFVAMDANGIVIGWNRQAESTFGWTRSEVVGQRLSDMIIPAQHRVAHERDMRHFAATGVGPVLNTRIEITALRRDGEEFPVELAIWPVNAGGTYTFNAFIRDISERVRAEASIRALNAELVANAAQLQLSNRELEAFSYTISHDLRAPLRHIDGYAGMLQEDAGDQLDAEMRRYLDAISTAARQMGALIDDLLAFSKLGRKPVERMLVDMAQLVERARQEVGGVDLGAGGRVTVGSLPAAHADPVLLKQVWVNLLSNALKYSAPRGADARIEVSGEQLGDRVRYRIRDNGVGFDMRYAEKLFGVFQRMHTQDEFEGTGVGLAIVQRIVVRHGGTIEADSAPGQGATFTFDLPAGAHSLPLMPETEAVA
jgi:PAS domain S-box-containing protein